jgi:prolyl 4-hydroxylase
MKNTTTLPLGPWVVTIDNFASEDETNHLLLLGNQLEYKRSKDSVMNPENGLFEDPQVYDFRTSYQVYCGDSCFEHPIVGNLNGGLLNRVSTFLGIGLDHCEDIQLLKYKEGGKYELHQDYHTVNALMSGGARVVTWLMYTEDVEEGGETNFPRIPVKIRPKKGRALVWSNVRDDDPLEEDLLARHEALPLVKGRKYAATAWFHNGPVKKLEEYDPYCA